MDFQPHLAAIYAGPAAVDATLTPAAGGAAVGGRVLFDQPGLVEDGMVISEPSARLMAGTWPSARQNDVFALGAAQYHVREILPIDDGAERRFILAKV